MKLEVIKECNFILIFGFAVTLTSCSKDIKKVPYKTEVASYSCPQLMAEERFQTKLIGEFTTGKTNINVFGDVAVSVLNFGISNIGSERNASSHKNYDAAISEAQNKIRLLSNEIKNKKCK